MSDDLLVKVILQERERQLRQSQLVAEAERARARSPRKFVLAARMIIHPRTRDRRRSERKAA